MEDNINRSFNRDAARQGLFYFRKSLFSKDDEDDGEGKETPLTGATPTAPQSHEHEYTLMSIDTIINGKVMLLYRGYISRGKCFTKITFQPIHKEKFLHFSSADHY